MNGISTIIGAEEIDSARPEPAKQTRFYGLDLLRAWGALAIMLLHIGQTFGSSRLFSRGYLAVDMFFLLSGFVLDQNYHHRLTGGKLTAGGYMAKRLNRLYPMIVIGVGIGAACVLFGAVAPSSISPFALLDFFIIPSMLSSSYVFVLDPPEWSLFFELVANSVQASLAGLLGARLLTIMVASFAALFLWVVFANRTADVGTMGMNFAQGFPRVGFGFFGGILLHRLWATGRFPRLGVVPPIALLLFPLSILLAGMIRHSPAVDAALIFVLFPIILWVAASTTVVGHWRTLAVYGGAMSYPLYALHHPLVTAVGRIMADYSLSFAWRSVDWVVFAALLCGICIWLDRNQARLLRRWRMTIKAIARFSLLPSPL